MKAAISAFLILAIDYFTRHTASNECHITSDERVFHNLSTANSFAVGLENKTVESFTRAEVMDAENIEVTDAKIENGEPLTLATFDPDTTEYAHALELFKTLELTADSNKKKDIYPALVAAKLAAETKTEE